MKNNNYTGTSLSQFGLAFLEEKRIAILSVTVMDEARFMKCCRSCRGDEASPKSAQAASNSLYEVRHYYIKPDYIRDIDTFFMAMDKWYDQSSKELA